MVHQDGRRSAGTWWLAPLAGLAVAALALAAASHAAQQAEAAPALKVAVVDMGRLLRQSVQWQDDVEERARLADGMDRTLDKHTRHVQVLRNEVENLPPGTDERRRKEAELEAALQERARTRLDFESRIARQHAESVRALFAEMERAVADHAAANDVHLVLKKQAIELSGPESVEQGLMIATAEVLYAHPSLDATDAVVEAMNAAYEGPIEVK
jgi:Skp family chaperone for outer membrane proteins